MGRPEPLSANHPHQQQGLSSFHETRDTRQGVRLARGAGCPLGRREFRGFHETRDTNHGFFSPWVRMGRTIRNPRPDRRTRRPVAAFLRVVARHGAAMARHGRHGPPRATVRAPSAPATGPFGFSRNTRHETRLLRPSEPPRPPTSRCFSVHNCSLLFGIVQQKILHLSQCPLSVHTGNAACKVFTKHESRNTVFPVPAATPRRATPSPTNGFFTKHETRNTNHGFFASLPTISHDFPRFPGISRHFPAPPPDQMPGLRPPFSLSLTTNAVAEAPVARSLLSCALWRGNGAAWAAWGAPSRCPSTIRTSNRAFRAFTKHETRDTAIAWRAARGALWAGANSVVFTNHGFF